VLSLAGCVRQEQRTLLQVKEILLRKQRQFPSSLSCQSDSCPDEGMQVPPIRFSSTEFYGFSEFWYSMEDVLRMGGPYMYDKYREASIVRNRIFLRLLQVPLGLLFHSLADHLATTRGRRLPQGRSRAGGDTVLQERLALHGRARGTGRAQGRLLIRKELYPNVIRSRDRSGQGRPLDSGSATLSYQIPTLEVRPVTIDHVMVDRSTDSHIAILALSSNIRIVRPRPIPICTFPLSNSSTKTSIIVPIPLLVSSHLGFPMFPSSVPWSARRKTRKRETISRVLGIDGVPEINGRIPHSHPHPHESTPKRLEKRCVFFNRCQKCALNLSERSSRSTSGTLLRIQCLTRNGRRPPTSTPTTSSSSASCSFAFQSWSTCKGSEGIDNN